jgi:preprotein translocase subunit SecD
MINRFPLWKNALVVIVLLVGLVYALPNVFSQDPSIEVSGPRGAAVEPALVDSVKGALGAAGISYKTVELKAGKLLVRFRDSESQLKAQDVIAPVLPDGSTAALTTLPDLPGWLAALGAKPMYLGLDLRGGIHVLIDVDMEAAVNQAMDRYSGDMRTLLRDKKVRYLNLTQQGTALDVKFPDAESLAQGERVLSDEFRALNFVRSEEPGTFQLRAMLTPAELKQIKKFALDQNITTLRNRVNALGVAEPIIQQQGERRIVVQLPGVQDPSRLKELLGATATLEYRLVDTEHDLEDALAGRVPAGSKLYKDRKGIPVLLKKRVIVTGNQITDATSGVDQRSGAPAVFVGLDSQGARRMREVTTENVGKPMAVVFIENRTVTRVVDGEPVKRKQLVEEVISIANILEPFGRRFQTTGIDSPAEARNLALLLRSGALAAPIEIIEERTIGPSLGQANVDRGVMSMVVGMACVMVFMIVYYRTMGLLANVSLLFNFIVIVGAMSLIQATLTLPGIAGIVLTVGMAVDANVLIYERIREELRLGNSPHGAIHAGFERAFGTILDSNLTTLISAVILFSFGSGPVRGFAVTLFIGILSTLFTAVTGTRALVNLLYGGRRLSHVSV